MKKCKNCGKCCIGSLYTTTPEYNKLTEKYKIHFQKFGNGYFLPQSEKCVFLGNSGCILKNDRFLICKLYPFELDSFDTYYLRDECPYKNYFDGSKIDLLLKEYKDKKLFTEDDVFGFLNVPFPNKI
jgi:Fe-S-cluster containining protein